MSLEILLSNENVARIGWTLIHFLWQGAVLAAILPIVLVFLRKSKAGLRYVAACATLALMAAAPCLTLLMLPPAETGRASTGTVEALAPAALPNSAGAVMTGEEVGGDFSVDVGAPVVSAEPVRPPLERAKALLEPALPYLVLGWLAGVLVLSAWHLGGWTQLQRYRRTMVEPVGERLGARVKHLAEILGIRRVVPVFKSALVLSPAVVGWLKPVILLPTGALTGLSTEQLEAILAHELGHIRRNDYLVNILQSVVEILGFYHPAVWWVSHKIRAERENCCDDIAVAVTGDKVRYARALASLEETRAARPGIAVAAVGCSLLGRIRRLLGKGPSENRCADWIAALFAVILVLAAAIPTTLAITARPPTEAEQMEVKTLFERILQAQRPAENMRVEFGYEIWAFPPGGARWVRKEDAGERKYVLWRHDYRVLISGRRSRMEWQIRLFHKKEDEEPFFNGRTIAVFDGNEYRSLAEQSKSGRRSPRDDNERELLVLLQGIPSDFKDLADYDELVKEYDFDITRDNEAGLYVLDAVRKEDGMGWQLTIDGNRGFNNVKTVLLSSSGSVSEQTNVRLREYGGGIWYPEQVEQLEYSVQTGDVRRRKVTSVRAEFDVDVAADAFELKWPTGTKVFDVFRRGHVTIGEDGEAEEFKPLSDNPPDAPRSANESGAAVTLPDGVVVELVGVCEHPSEGRRWWRPDGRNLAEDARPYRKLNMLALARNQQENKLLELAVRIANVAYEPAGITSDAGDRGFRKYGDNIYAGTIEVPKDQDERDITLGIAAGMWETAAISEAVSGRRRRSTEGFAFTEAYDFILLIPVAARASGTGRKRRPFSVIWLRRLSVCSSFRSGPMDGCVSVMFRCGQGSKRTCKRLPLCPDGDGRQGPARPELGFQFQGRHGPALPELGLEGHLMGRRKWLAGRKSLGWTYRKRLL